MFRFFYWIPIITITLDAPISCSKYVEHYMHLLILYQ